MCGAWECPKRRTLLHGAGPAWRDHGGVIAGILLAFGYTGPSMVA